MKKLIILLCFFFSAPIPTYSTDQIYDLLIIKGDTVHIRTFPLEELSFAIRPFSYGGYASPDLSCLRGYQATWQVIDKKLFLVRLAKVDAPNESIDIVKYFEENNYDPVVINGMIFADWYSRILAAFPKKYKYWGCEWKPRKAKKLKPAIRFENGIMVRNNYKHRKQ
jgi:hypothetical protein